MEKYNVLEQNADLKNNVQSFYYRVFPYVFVYSIIINYYLRSSILSPILAYLNIIPLIMILSYFLINIKKINIRFFNVIILSVMIIISNQSSIYGSIGGIDSFQSIAYLILPLMLFSINIEQVDFSIFLSRFLKIFNVAMIVVFLCMLLDFLSSGKFYQEFTTIFTNFTPFYQKNLGGVIRYPSILGHQLITKTCFLLYFIFNFLYNRATNKYIMNPYIVIITSLIGITLTGSKTGIVLLLLILAYLNMKSKNFVLLICVILSMTVFFYLGIFDSIVERFTSTSLTTGRFDAWNQIKYNLPQVQLFKGYGDNFFNGLKYFYNDFVIVAAFEFPFIGLSFLYGIGFTIIFYLEIFLIPLFTFFRKKDKAIFLSYLIFLIDINTYNQIIFNPDMVTFIIMINFIFFSFMKVSYSRGGTQI